LARLTEYFTSTEHKPVTETAKSAKTGPATVILTGFAAGLESSVWSIVAIAVTILSSMLLFHGDAAMAAYGVALSGLGLLTTTGFILAMDTYGPISDNANGIFEMSGALKDAGEDSDAHRIVAKLDAVGNTTKALTKGFAIATAVIAAVALFRSFMADAGSASPHHAELGYPTTDLDALNSGIRIDWTQVFIGMLIGGAVPFLFCSFAINAVSRAAFQLVEEVRRQFREIPGIMEYDPRSSSTGVSRTTSDALTSAHPQHRRSFSAPQFLRLPLRYWWALVLATAIRLPAQLRWVDSLPARSFPVS
jgi:K(+)-stimulated pyrophosphate-energized sodium pump